MGDVRGLEADDASTILVNSFDFLEPLGAGDGEGLGGEEGEEEEDEERELLLRRRIPGHPFFFFAIDFLCYKRKFWQ